MMLGYVCTNYNNAAVTRAAVASLVEGTRGADVRIVVVDNQSRPDDVDALRGLGAQYQCVSLVLSPRNVGYFPGLNLGIRRIRELHSDIDILVIGNNDLVFPPDFVATVERHRDVLERQAVVAPDLVTLDGQHQNPHVLHPISAVRRAIWDIHYASYPAALLVRQLARLTRSFTVREENAPGAALWRRAGPVEQGYGACYLLGPAFFRHFECLAAPTFLMQEEFFLFEQLKTIGQLTWYDPRFVVRHQAHATMGKLPGRRSWVLARDAHLIYKRYRRLSPSEQRDFLARHGGAARATEVAHA